MDLTTFEQREVSLDALGTARQYLHAGCTVKVLFHEGNEISVSLPDEVELAGPYTSPLSQLNSSLC